MLLDPLNNEENIKKGYPKKQGIHHGREAKRIPWVMTKRDITTIVYSRPSDNPHLLNRRWRFPREASDVSKKNKWKK